MAEIVIRLAANEDDVKAAQSLCHEWLDWHWQNYPPDWPRGDDHPMDPTRFKAIVETLSDLHARPRGGIVIAWVDEVPFGCVMYAQARPGVAEFNRMFVSPDGRGHGLGRKMLDHMFDRMVADGYGQVFFYSAAFLSHARAMYEEAGFKAMPPPAGFPDTWRGKVYFMDRSLP
ncbi:MAG: GNAT family N-acetyltransferase [Pseudomonadota bacterium]